MNHGRLLKILTIFIAIIISLSISAIIILPDVVWDKEYHVNSFVIDPNGHITVDPNNNFEIVLNIGASVYTPKEYLEEICWVRALTKLAQDL